MPNAFQNLFSPHVFTIFHNSRSKRGLRHNFFHLIAGTLPSKLCAGERHIGLSLEIATANLLCKRRSYSYSVASSVCVCVQVQENIFQRSVKCACVCVCNICIDVKPLLFLFSLLLVFMSFNGFVQGAVAHA